MERHNLHPTNSDQQAARYCQAQTTDACRERGGLLETDRRPNAKLCRDCARRRMLDRSAERKRDFRRSQEPDKGWRVYREKYSPYVSEEHRLREQREYQQLRRARLRIAQEEQDEETNSDELLEAGRQAA